MNAELLERRFAAIGARVEVDGPALGRPTIDVRRDRGGETPPAARPTTAG